MTATSAASSGAVAPEFKSPGQAQRFRAAYGPIAQHCRRRHYLFPAPVYRQDIGQRFDNGWAMTSLPTAAYRSPPMRCRHLQVTRDTEVGRQPELDLTHEAATPKTRSPYTS